MKSAPSKDKTLFEKCISNFISLPDFTSTAIDFDITEFLNSEQHKIALAFSIYMIVCRTIESICFQMHFWPLWLVYIIYLGSCIACWYTKNKNALKFVVFFWTSLFSVIGCYVFKLDRMLFNLPINTIVNPIFCLILTRSSFLTIITILINTAMVGFSSKSTLKLLLKTTSFDTLDEMVDITMIYAIEYSVAIILLMMLFSNHRWNLHAQLGSQKEQLQKLNAELQHLNKQLIVKNERLEESIQSKDNFLLSVSHELRNPLNVILGNLELALAGTSDTLMKSYIENAKNSGEILGYLINNLLDSGKLESSDLEISKISTNIRLFLEKMWSTCKILIQRKNLHGELYIAKNLPSLLEIDPHRLMQIMLNLISNSAKFTDHGFVKIVVSWLEPNSSSKDLYEPSNLNQSFYNMSSLHSEKKMSENTSNIEGDTITVLGTDFDEGITRNIESYKMEERIKTLSNLSYLKDYDKMSFTDVNCRKRAITDPKLRPVTHKNQNQGYLKIEVIDSGCGMNPDAVQKLFKKFSQVGSNMTQKRIGSGLGLWISKSLSRKMEGDVRVVSQENKGSIFIITLQCTKSQADIHKRLLTSKEREKAGQNPGEKKLKALVVDDIKTNQILHKRFLEMCGVDIVDIAVNGYEAFEIFKKKGRSYYDMIFMDLDMPVMDGKVASKLIREYERIHRWEPVKLAIVTGNYSNKEFEECLAKNGAIRADHWFSKPFTMSQCKNLIGGAMVENKLCETVPTELGNKSSTSTDRINTLEPLQNAHSLQLMNTISTSNTLLSSNNDNHKIEAASAGKNKLTEISTIKFRNDDRSKPITTGQLNESLKTTTRADISDQRKQINAPFLTTIESIVNTDPEREKLVLLADDDVFHCQLINSYFQKCKIKSITVHNGLEAFQQYKQNYQSIGMILIDCEMPRMDGWEATAKICEFMNQNHCEAIPICALTGHVGQDYFRRCKDAGMTRVMTKPINFQQLIEMTLDHLRH